MSETTQKFYTRQVELIDLINKNNAKIAELDVVNEATIELKTKELTREFQIRAGKIRGQIEDLEKHKVSLEEALHKGNWDEYDRLLDEINKIQEALNNEEVFEQYVRTYLSDDATIDKIIDRESLKLGKVILNPNINVNNKVRWVAQFLRDELIKIGESEVAIGKLKPEQFEEMMLKYLPHILTDEGQKIFTNVDEMLEHLPRVNISFGLGTSYNPTKSRYIKKIPDGKGGFIYPNLLQIEEWMQRKYGKILKGKNAFQTNLADIYLIRALKNTELIYNNEYMNNMLGFFGKDYTGVVEEGYSIAMSYDKFKEIAVTTAKLNMMCDISDDLSNMLKSKIKDIETRAISKSGMLDYKIVPLEVKLENKRIFHEELEEEIRKYLNAHYSEEVRKNLFKHKLNIFSESTKTGGLLEDLAVPMIELDDFNAKAITNSLAKAKDRYLKKIRKDLISYEGNKLVKFIIFIEKIIKN